MTTVTGATLDSVLLAETDHPVVGDHQVEAGHLGGEGRHLVEDDRLVVTDRHFAVDRRSVVVEGMTYCLSVVGFVVCIKCLSLWT